MNGITILREVIKDRNPLSLFIISGVAFIFLILIFIHHKKYPGFIDAGFTSFVVSAVIIPLIFSFLIIQENKANKEKVYDVLIDDSVTVNDFFEHYKVEKIDGKIYTVKEMGSID